MFPTSFLNVMGSEMFADESCVNLSAAGGRRAKRSKGSSSILVRVDQLTHRKWILRAGVRSKRTFHGLRGMQVPKYQRR
jgi:hypothetical protein